MIRLFVFFALLVAGLFTIHLPLNAEEPPAAPAFVDTPTPAPEPPTEKQVQKAVMRCLSSVDSAIAASRRNPRSLGAAEEGEERYCFEQKKECKDNPTGYACRNFIRDYVGE